MTTIASARLRSSAPPAAFFERWADTDTWPQWNHDTEWVRLDGAFTEGATGTLKPTGGPVVPFTVERLVPGREFVDVSRLFGARLVFDHQVTPATDGGCSVEVTVTLTGPLAVFWRAVLGRGIAASCERDLAALAEVAEGRRSLSR